MDGGNKVQQSNLNISSCDNGIKELGPVFAKFRDNLSFSVLRILPITTLKELISKGTRSSYIIPTSIEKVCRSVKGSFAMKCLFFFDAHAVLLTFCIIGASSY